MNARLRKEFALLGPTFWLALALAVLPPLVLTAIPGADPQWHGSRVALGCLFFTAGMVLLSVTSFGREFNHRTVSLLLSQPVGRDRLWLEKAGLLCVLALLVLGAFLGAEWITGAFVPEMAPFSIPANTIAWIALMAVAGGLWTTVFFRNAVASLWFTVLIPAALVALVELLARDPDWDNIESICKTVWTLYAIAGVILSWRLFKKTEDTTRFGQEITLRLGWSRSRVAAGVPTRTPATPFVALFSKELHLHQIPLMVFASGSVVLIILAFGVRVFGQANAYRQQYDWLEAAWCLLMVGLIPPLIGSLAIAEERKLGTADAQQCLPLSRARQFVVKWLVAHALGVALGYFAARLLAMVLAWIAGPSGGLGGLNVNFWHGSLLYSLAGVTVGMYGSSLARNTLGAMGITIGVGVVVYGLVFFAYLPIPFQSNTPMASYLIGHLWSSRLFLIILVPLLVLFFWRMTFLNFGAWNSPGRMWRNNLVSLFALVGTVCVASGLIFNRVWELAENLEPRQGFARLAPSDEVKVAAYGWRDAFVLLPDGKLRLCSAVPVSRTPNSATWKAAVSDVGSNWTAVACGIGWNGYPAATGIQSDGSLWRIVKQVVATRQTGGTWVTQIEMSRISSDLGWRTVAGGAGAFLAIKEDGSLWGGTNAPAQIGTDSDWVQVFALQGRSVAVKRDGSTWVWGRWPTQLYSVAQPTPIVEPVRLNSAFNGPWHSLSLGLDRIVATREDGSLWIWNDPVSNANPPVRIGTDSDWKGAASGFGWNVICALKSDGTLWKFYALPRMLRAGNPVKLSQYSTWLTLDGDTQTIDVLARDGTVCCWNGQYGLNMFYYGELLRPTRRPLFLGNVFAAEK